MSEVALGHSGFLFSTEENQGVWHIPYPGVETWPYRRTRCGKQVVVHRFANLETERPLVEAGTLCIDCVATFVADVEGGPPPK